MRTGSFTLPQTAEDAAGNLYIVDLGGEIFRVLSREFVPSLPSAGLPVLMALLTVGGLWQLRQDGRRD